MSDTNVNGENLAASIDDEAVEPQRVPAQDPLAGDGDGADGDDALAGPDEPIADATR